MKTSYPNGPKENQSLFRQGHLWNCRNSEILCTFYTTKYSNGKPFILKNVIPSCDQSISTSHHIPSVQGKHLVGQLFSSLIPTVLAQEAVQAQPQEADKSPLPDVKPETLVSDTEIQQYLQNETGRDRLRAMFQKDHKNHLSPDLAFVVAIVKSSSLLTFATCAILGSRNAKEEFVRKNKHTKFLTKYRALRSYQDAIFMGGLKFGTQWALKTGFFISIFLLTSQSITVYRNKTTPLEYSAGGMLTGALLRLNLGLRGFVAGGIIGGTMGTICGIIIAGTMWLGNETQEQRHYWQIQELLQMKKELQTLAGTSS